MVSDDGGMLNGEWDELGDRAKALADVCVAGRLRRLGREAECEKNDPSCEELELTDEQKESFGNPAILRSEGGTWGFRTCSSSSSDSDSLLVRFSTTSIVLLPSTIEPISSSDC